MYVKLPYGVPKIPRHSDLDSMFPYGFGAVDSAQAPGFIFEILQPPRPRHSDPDEGGPAQNILHFIAWAHARDDGFRGKDDKRFD